MEQETGGTGLDPPQSSGVHGVKDDRISPLLESRLGSLRG